MTYLATHSQKLTPKNTARYLCLLIAVAFIALFSLSPIAHHIENRTSLPTLFHWRGPLPAPTDIIIIGLNASAAERMGLSRHSHNWPRTLYAQLLDKLSIAKTKLVVFDVAFKAARTEQEDQPFETAIANNGNVLLYTYLKRHQVALANGFVDIEEPIPPLSRFAQRALGVGHFTLPKTAHNVTNTLLFAALGSGPQASQPLLGVLALTPLPDQKQFWQSLTQLPFPEKATPAERAQQFRQHTMQAQRPYNHANKKQNKRLFKLFSRTAPLVINYFGGAKTFQNIDIDKALALSTADFAQHFKDKTVYIGYLETHQTEQQDAYSTIYTSDTGIDVSGVEISATVFANLRQGNDIQKPPQWLKTLICLGFLIGGFGIWYHYFSLHLVLQSLLLGGYISASHYAFSHHHYALPLTLPLFALALGNLLQLQRQFCLNRTRLSHIRYALTQYLPSEAANALSKNINTLEKQHTLVHGVVLMTDIKGYTSLSETLPPASLHQLMNAYYKELIAAVQNNGGTIGNIVGDSLMAMWTGSNIDNAMCQRAIKAVMEIQTSVSANAEFAQHLPTCIALHGGQFSLGNLGAQGHFEYSPVGDIINTVSRIEHFNRDLGTEFLCSEVIAETLTSTHKNQRLLKLGEFALRNKKDAVALYTLIMQETAESQRDIANFVLALEKKAQGDHSSAHTLLKHIKHPTLLGASNFHIRESNNHKAP